MKLEFSMVEFVFLVTLAVTFVAAYLGRKHSKQKADGLSGENLNRWMVGLSAGATANSGFIVTGAVGLGYSFGPQWIFLPIAWFIGDLVFWKLFPAKINQFGRNTGVTTLSELLASGLVGKYKTVVSAAVSLLIVLCIGGYTTAQWVAGQKFVAGAFNFSAELSLILFAVLIIAYSSIGGFRGSIYADTVQAVIRLVGTTIALALVIWAALANSESFENNITNAGNNFLAILPGSGALSALFFILGFAFASLGFGLGQPQLISRYLAGASPEETQAAKWIYIGFIQFTWISMTIFGVLLRGVMPDIDDPETGLSLFFVNHSTGIITGVIMADIFATIAATSNSLLVAMAQSVIHDLFPANQSNRSKKVLMTIIVVALGFLTMVGALYLNETSSVFSLALGSVSLLGAGLAAPVMIKLLNLKHTAFSLLISIIFGLIFAILWKQVGFDSFFNEAGIGIFFGLITNKLLVLGDEMRMRNKTNLRIE